MDRLYAGILAAGLGTRMRSNWPKVLHHLGGRPMLAYAVDAVTALAPAEVVVVIGHGGERVRALLGNKVRYAVQAEQLGTGHALGVAVSAIDAAEGDLLVTYGDMPLLTADTLRRLLDHHRATGSDATLITAMLGENSRYGRIIRDQAGRFLKIVEYRDATSAERQIPEVNVGVYCFRLQPLRAALPKLGRSNAQGEYYLTDLFALLSADGSRVEAIAGERPSEFEGPNDRLELAAAEARLREAVNRRWLEQGVTMIDPAATYIEPGVTIGRDTIIYPGTVIRGRAEIGAECRLGPNAEIRDARLGRGVKVAHAVIVESEVAANEEVGPFVYLMRGIAYSGRVPAVSGPRKS
ncbi:MAG: bifunctional N-acetylglucosamine-1-phosphate uridyltransferase/glucosamine-1-phosphate acetyltransferase [Bacteroidota bacterium]